MLKKLTVTFLTGILVLAPIAQQASAERLSTQISNKEKTVNEKKDQLSDARKSVNELEKTIKQLDSEVKSAQTKLDDTKKKIRKTTSEIEKKKENIKLLQHKLEKREDILRERLVAMQEQPKVNVVTQVILGSEGIVNMLERLSAINTLFEADNNIMEQQKREQALLDKEKEALHKTEKSLNELENKQIAEKKELVAKKDEKNQALNEAQRQMQTLISEVNEESAELNELNRQALFLQQQVEEQEQGSSNQGSSNQGSSNQGSSNQGSTSTPSEKPKPNPTPSPAPGSGDVVSYAMQFIGVPYVFGGASPSGFDCSGFIWYVYKNNGHNIGRASVGTYWSMAKKISSPSPGDLVFFQNTYKPGPSHIGIYIGGGKMVHAGSKGIAVSSLSTSYNKKHFLGYGRF